MKLTRNKWKSGRVQMSDITALNPGIFLEAQKTGSSFVCDPIVTNTDEDWIVRVSRYLEAMDILLGLGFVNEGQLYGGRQGFVSMRYRKLNFILIDNEDVYFNYCMATNLAQLMNLTNKIDRCILFWYVIDGELAESRESIEEMLADKDRRKAEAPPEPQPEGITDTEEFENDVQRRREAAATRYAAARHLAGRWAEAPPPGQVYDDF